VFFLPFPFSKLLVFLIVLMQLVDLLVRSLMPFVNVGGEVVVGNFSEFNASRDYMELMGDWYLEHRSEGRLRELAEKAGAKAGQVEVKWEPEGVNLFVHVAV
jgi:hypothetical protein